MGNTLQIAVLATLGLSAGCVKYDRALLGAPRPEPVQVVVEDAVSEPVVPLVEERKTFDFLPIPPPPQWLEGVGYVRIWIIDGFCRIQVLQRQSQGTRSHSPNMTTEANYKLKESNSNNNDGGTSGGKSKDNATSREKKGKKG